MKDPLTGLMDRAAIQQLAEANTLRRNRVSTPLAVLLIDVDHLNDINLRYGLAGGDKVLVTLAGIIRISIRPFDSVGRHGGDQFLIFAPNIDFAEADRLAERIRAMIEDAVIPYLDQSIPARVSIGVAVVEGTGAPEFEEIMKVAGTALAQAKVTGRNRCMVCSFD